MDYEDQMRKAARRAERGVNRAVSSLRDKRVRREDDLTGVLKGNLDAELEGQMGGLTWECSIVNHGSGTAAHEKEFGADILIHVKFNARRLKYSKGVLIQAKRLEPGERMISSEYARLVEQCETMLVYTPAAFVFDYSKSGVRCGSATSIAGSTNQYLNEQCVWTSYRFFLELFRCPIGDPKIVSAYPEDLRVKATVKMVATES